MSCLRCCPFPLSRCVLPAASDVGLLGRDVEPIVDAARERDFRD